MKKSLITLFLIQLLSTIAVAQTSPDYIFGSDNGSGWNWTTGTAGTANLGGSYLWQFASTTTGNHYFKLGETSSSADGQGFWVNADGADMNYTGAGAMWAAYYRSNMGDGGAIYFAITNGNYYVIKSQKHSSDNDCNFAVFDNGAQAPVTITGVDRSFDASNLYVDVQLNGSMSANEKVWVRYSTDNWVTSNTVEANSDQGGNKWRATIPRIFGVYSYYSYTTIQRATAPAEADADFYTVAYSNNNGYNYTVNLAKGLNYVMESSASGFTYLVGGNTFTWTGNSNDAYSDPVNIGFTFSYCGVEFTQFQASTNGFIRLGTGLAASLPTDALSGTTRNILAPLWDDLDVVDLANVTYLVEGTPGDQILTVEYKGVKWNRNAATANAEFQIKLYEKSQKIEFVYGTMTAPTSPNASIGLADTTNITSTTNLTTGAFLSINVGGTSGAREYHQSMNWTFYFIGNAPDNNTKFTFNPIAQTPIAGGTYSIGGISPNFASFSEAAVNLNVRGISGAVVLVARDGTYDDIFHINEIEGISSTNTLTLEKETGATVILRPRNGSGGSTTGALGSSDCIIRLCGTQYTTIQNLNLEDNGQTTVNLKFEIGVGVANSVSRTGGMKKGAQHNTFKNLNIDMKSTTGANHSGSICFRYFTTSSTETDISLGTSYNTIDGCYLTGFWRAGWKNYGISGTNPDRENIMRNCTLGNFSITTGTGSDIRALEMDCQRDLLIEDNVIENIEATIMTTNNIYGMWFNPAASTSILISGTNIIRNNTIRNLENSGSGTTNGFAVGIASNNVANNTEFQIYNNKIYDLYSNGNGTSRAIGIGMYMSTGNPTTVKIYNNMIYDLRCPRSTNAPSARGLDCQNNGTNGLFQVYNNTVYLDNAVPPTNAAHQSCCIYWANFGTATLDLRNNILVNLMSTSTGKSVCLYPSANSNYLRLSSTTDNNLYFWGAGVNQGISWDAATLRTTLAQHQAAVATGGLGGPRDVYSIAADVTNDFVSKVSPYDVHINNTGWIPNGQGKPTSLVTTDIDGDARLTDVLNGPVDIGADEYTPTGSATATQTGTIADGNTTTYTGVDGKVIGTITWHDLGGTLPTSVTFTYKPGEQVNDVGIYRIYEITETGGAPDWTADVQLYYNSSTELRGFDEATMRINKSDDAGATWNALLTTMNTTAHYGQVDGITSFSLFSFGDATTPLPVQMTTFTATAQGQSVMLKWITAQEINTYKFEIERQSAGSNWTKIGEVQAQGNSSVPTNYSFADNNLVSGKYSYRLKMIDNDGTFEYSKVVEAEISAPTEYTLSQNYPNPFNPTTKIDYSIPEATNVKILIYSVTGELVSELVNEYQSAGKYTVEFDASNLASGTYIYRIMANNYVETKKMILLK